MGKSIAEVSAMSITDCADFLDKLTLSGRDLKIAERVLKEVNERLRFLVDVGLDYLSLNRPAGSSPAVRPSASGWPPRSAPAWSACSTSWTSPRSASTSATTTG